MYPKDYKEGVKHICWGGGCSIFAGTNLRLPLLNSYVKNLRAPFKNCEEHCTPLLQKTCLICLVMPKVHFKNYLQKMALVDVSK